MAARMLVKYGSRTTTHRQPFAKCREYINFACAKVQNDDCSNSFRIMLNLFYRKHFIVFYITCVGSPYVQLLFSSEVEDTIRTATQSKSNWVVKYMRFFQQQQKKKNNNNKTMQTVHLLCADWFGSRLCIYEKMQSQASHLARRLGMNEI